MNLPDKALIELKQIYKSEFGMEMPDDEVQAEAKRLLSFFYAFFLWEQNHFLPTNQTLDTELDYRVDDKKGNSTKAGSKGEQLSLF